MKTAFCVALGAFFLTMAAALPAKAAFTIQDTDSSTAQTFAPSIQVSTDSTTSVNIGNYKIRYFIYEPDLPWTPPAPTNVSPAGTAISVTPLDHTYTGQYSGRLATPMANYVVSITVPANKTIKSGGNNNFTVSFRLAAKTARGTGGWNDYSVGQSGNITFQQANGTGYLWGTPPGTTQANSRSVLLGLAQQNIKHVIFIMQENRSFDSYFGTFPNPSASVVPNGNATAGVNGINNAPAGNRSTSCSGTATTYNPGLLTATVNPASGSQVIWDLPHSMPDAKTILGCANPNSADRACSGTGAIKISDFLNESVTRGPGCVANGLKQTVGHYQGWPSSNPNTHDVLWNHWTIAQNFLLQDAMFEQVPSWSMISHVFMVSGWSAQCDANQQNCVENYQGINGYYGWQEVTQLFRNASPQVNWGYYRGENWSPTCGSTNNVENCKDVSNNLDNCFNQSTGLVEIWNPLPNFNTVYYGGQTGNVRQLQDFLLTATEANSFHDPLPQVSWIVPAVALSEHDGAPGEFGGAPYNAPYVDLRNGEAYVTMILQQIMQNSYLWNNSVIFLAWDDWGGYYDHVRPPTTTINGVTSLMYGLRVPGITISPWLGIGKLDHQTLSFDAYLKFVEDIFVGGQRIGVDPSTGAVFDGRTAVRENEPQMGNLLDEFDFYKVPKAPPTAVTSLSCQGPG